MSLHDQFKTNSDKELNGVPVQFAPNKDKTVPTFILSRMGKMNKGYTKALEKATRPYRRQIELKTMDPDVAEAVFMIVFIQTILRGWENVQLPKLSSPKEMEVLEFNEENAKRLLIELPDLYEDLQAESVNVSNFHDDVLEDEAKN